MREVHQAGSVERIAAGRKVVAAGQVGCLVFREEIIEIIG